MTTTPWPAPRARGPLAATVRVPGSKSITNRGLVLGALSTGTTVLRGALRSRDTALMAAGLRVLGAKVDNEAPDRIVVRSPGPPLCPGGARIDVGNAGTVARFLPPVATLATGAVTFDGDPRVRERPIAPLLAALRALGGSVEPAPGGGLPAVVHGRGRLPGGEVTLDAAASSQLVSGLLLAAPAYDDGAVIRHAGARLPSQPHLAMTVAMLRDASAAVETDGMSEWRVRPGPLRPRDVTVEPDLSGAAAFLAAPLVAGGWVRVAGWPADSTQPGAVLPDLLAAMGAEVVRDADGLTVAGDGPALGIDVDLRDCGELVPVLAAVAATAATASRFGGVGHLRGQETDRLAALAREMQRLGGDVRETADGLAVRPRRLHGGLFATYDDHRLAMAAAVLGLGVDGVLVENVATVGKTLPDFPRLWREMADTAGAGS